MKKTVAFFLAVCMLIMATGCTAESKQEPENAADSVFYTKVIHIAFSLSFYQVNGLFDLMAFLRHRAPFAKHFR